ncbi:phage l protein [Yersinia kristensenii]|nr:phage l protein [Yersinia kristensenii]
MDIELTGNETPEELEALIDGFGDVDISDVTQTAAVTTTPIAVATDETNAAVLNTGDKKDELTPGATTTAPATEVLIAKTAATTPAATTESTEKPKGILSKDGQHVIPYDVLVAERAEKQRLVGSNQQTATELAEARRQLAALTRQINSAGMQPVPLPEKAQVTPEQINSIRENFPEMAAVLDTVVQKIDYLQQGQPAEPAHQSSGNPVADAINAVPDLKSWQDQDPDRFTLAVHIDTNLQNDPAWKDKSLTERFVEVAKRTKAAYGESVEPVKQQQATTTAATTTTTDMQRIAAEKLAAATAATQVPGSPSDLGVTTTHTASPLEQAANASPDQLQAMFAGMTDAQIEALLDQAI